MEFDGEFEPNAAWYRPLMTRIRMELNAKDPSSPAGWARGGGGSHNAVWRINLADDALRTPVEPRMAHAAVKRAVQAFNSFPHELGIVLDTF